MITESSVEIAAPADVVWAEYADVERWSEWTASVKRVRGLDGPELAVGRRFEIEQPRLPKLVWTVTALDPGRSWVWASTAPGGRTEAFHEVRARDGGGTAVRQGLDQRGPVGALVGRAMRGLTRRYLELEAQGLKASSEARHLRDAPSA